MREAPGPPPVPRLHAIAADEVLDGPDFTEAAAAVLRAGGPELALHLRAHGRPGGRLLALAERLAPAAASAGAWLVLNDRVDVALAVAPLASTGVVGVQLGARSLPVGAVRALGGVRLRIGYSVHGLEEVWAASADGADWLLLGTIFATPSHPGRAGGGPALVAEAAARLEERSPGGPGMRRVPLIAIGGVTPGRVPRLRSAGAHGVAVLRGVWGAADPVAALEKYLAALREAVDSKG